MIRFWLRYHRYGLALLILMTVPTVHWSAKLYGNLKPDLEELLPRKARAILDLGEIRSRLKSVQKLNILISSKNAQAAKRFQVDLAQRLEALGPEDIASVEYKIDKELKFFSDRKSLFLEVADLESIRDYIKNRIDYERQLYNPLNIFSGIELPEPYFDFRTLERKYQGQASQYSHFPEGMYALPDGTERLIAVYLPSSRAGIDGVYAFKKQIAGIIEQLGPPRYSPDLRIEYAGQVQDIIEEHSALINDIERSAEIVFTIVVAALVIFFRSFLATAALLLTLFMARFWTFGASWFAVGYLNANSAFMGSIVLGSGITFGVMLLARYAEERRARRTPLRAAFIAIRYTTRATWAAALCAGLAYGSLFLTSFEGFKQYGIIGLIGMVLCWISSVLVLPAFLLVIESRFPLFAKQRKGGSKAFIFDRVTALLSRFPKALLAASAVLTLVSIIGIARLNFDDSLEKNLAKLRNRESMEKGSGFFAKKVDEILRSPNSPVVVLAHSKPHAEEIARRLEEQRKREGKNTLILQVADISRFIPPHQDEKIRILNQIRGLLRPDILARLSPADREKANSLLDPHGFNKITMENLPQLVKDKFTEKSGAIGQLILVDPLQDSERWSGPQLNKFVGDIRDTADTVEGRKVPVAGGITVTSDMIASIIRDGPRATLFAFVAVVIVVFLLFRHPPTVLLMLSSLIVGSIWMFGAIAWFDIKINFLNFIAFPITFGIGVDYGVNMFDRYLRERNRGILRVIKETGGAVGLCSFTTIVGYSSLLIAKNNAFVSFGIVAVLGEVTTMTAAVIALPSIVLLWERRKGSQALKAAGRTGSHASLLRESRDLAQPPAHEPPPSREI